LAATYKSCFALANKFISYLVSAYIEAGIQCTIAARKYTDIYTPEISRAAGLRASECIHKQNLMVDK